MAPRLPLALALVLSLGGCGADETPSPAAPVSAVAATPSAPRGAAAATVAIAGFAYKPVTVRVRVGGLVTWVNRDAAAHTATFTAGPDRLDTGRLRRGDRAALRFPTAGRYDYVCAPHAFMQGEIVVVD